MVLPFSPVMSVTAGSRTTSDSASPMTSWIQMTSTGRSSGAERARVEGEEPASPMSMLPEPKAWTTSPPEAKLLHSTVALGRQASRMPWSFTTTSPLGIFW